MAQIEFLTEMGNGPGGAACLLAGRCGPTIDRPNRAAEIPTLDQISVCLAEFNQKLSEAAPAIKRSCIALAPWIFTPSIRSSCV